MRNSLKRYNLAISACCNNNCVFCMERNDNKPRPLNTNIEDRKYLTVSLLKKIIPDLDKSISIMLTNGEPTLSQELIDIVRTLKNNSFSDITLQTNGRRLSHMDYCIELIKAGITSFSISIHGSNYKIHEALTRTRGSFQQTFSGIENLLKLKKLFPYLKIFTTTTVNKINVNDIKNLMKLFIDGRPLINTMVLNPVALRGNALLHSKNLAISYTSIFESVNRSLLELGIGKTEKLVITDLPQCINSFYSGPSEDIYQIKRKNKIKHIPLKVGEESSKRSKCAECIYYNTCPGVSCEYIKTFGWDEFIPIKK